MGQVTGRRRWADYRMTDSEYALRRAIDIERTAVATALMAHRRQRYGQYTQGLHARGFVDAPYWSGHERMRKCTTCRTYREELARWTELQYTGLGR
jgi:hypothetical protein